MARLVKMYPYRRPGQGGLPERVRLNEGLGRIAHRQLDWTAHVATKIKMTAKNEKPADNASDKSTLPVRDHRLRTNASATAMASMGAACAAAEVGRYVAGSSGVNAHMPR